MTITEVLICERCDAVGADKCGLMFLCPACVVALGLCESCCREEGTCVVDDRRLCNGCADDADMPEDMSEGWED